MSLVPKGSCPACLVPPPVLRRYVAVAVGLMLVGVTLGGCKRTSHLPDRKADPPVGVGEIWLTPQQMRQAKIELQVVREEDVDDTIITSGRVAFDDQHVSHVFSPVTGRVIRVDAQLGARVKKGQALATIQSPDIGSATSDLGKARADLVAAQHDYERKQKLFEDHATSQADLEQAEDNFNKAKAERDRAQQKAALLRTGGAVDLVSSTFTLVAGIDGEVLLRNLSPGAEIQGQYSGGTAVELFTVGDLRRVWVLADVFEMDINRIKVGENVVVNVVANPTRIFTGKVDWVSGMLDPTTRTVKVRCIFDNADLSLKPEMYATIQVRVEERRALAIPRTALLRLGDQTVVFVKTAAAPDGRMRFQQQRVTVDEGEREKLLPVTRGLEAGNEIVISGGILLAGMF